MEKIPHALRAEFDTGYAPRSQSWQPGWLHSNLSWTHYRTLLRVEKPEARAFYEIEALQNNWSARELERQINSLLYERLALSRDKKGLLRLARKGQEIQGPLGQPIQTPPALRSRVKGGIVARAEKHRPGRRRPTGPGKEEDQAMNPALHDKTWIGCGTSLLWDAAALIRRMPLLWCAQIGFQSPV